MSDILEIFLCLIFIIAGIMFLPDIARYGYMLGSSLSNFIDNFFSWLLGRLFVF